jgi:AhpD family alkylhydroperoxidase
MAPGALDLLTKELMYVAVSVTNGCAYCIASHTAAARQAGMSAAMFAELLAVVGMANTTNRLANGYQVEIDDRFRPPTPVMEKHGELPSAAGAPGAPRRQRSRQPPQDRSAGAAAGEREAAQPRAAAQVKRAAASEAAHPATGQATRRRGRR